MFRGNHPATVDSKGRLKVPAAFRSRLLQDHGRRLFVTSLDGESVCLYPMPVWEEIEGRLLGNADLASARRKLLLVANYYGHEVQLDAQGRVLLPPRLRSGANTIGKADVLGKGRHLEAWDHETLRHRIEGDPLSGEEIGLLAEAGI